MKKKQPRNPIKIAPWPTLGSRPIQVLKLYNISSKSVFTKILDALGCLLNTRLWFVWLQHFVFLSGICLPDWPWGGKKKECRNHHVCAEWFFSQATFMVDRASLMLHHQSSAYSPPPPAKVAAYSFLCDSPCTSSRAQPHWFSTETPPPPLLAPFNCDDIYHHKHRKIILKMHFFFFAVALVGCSTVCVWILQDGLFKGFVRDTT